MPTQRVAPVAAGQRAIAKTLRWGPPSELYPAMNMGSSVPRSKVLRMSVTSSAEVAVRLPSAVRSDSLRSRSG